VRYVSPFPLAVTHPGEKEKRERKKKEKHLVTYRKCNVKC
jgi:hypothetical protein